MWDYNKYDYRHSDGELFSCVADTLKECRQRRDARFSILSANDKDGNRIETVEF